MGDLCPPVPLHEGGANTFAACHSACRWPAASQPEAGARGVSQARRRRKGKPGAKAAAKEIEKLRAHELRPQHAHTGEVNPTTIQGLAVGTKRAR
eukprot:scaffold60663_cov75-Phaeocystis_antarctica.AAC.3